VGSESLHSWIAWGYVDEISIMKVFYLIVLLQMVMLPRNCGIGERVGINSNQNLES